MTDRSYDVLAVGRSAIDLYAREVGVPFTEVKSFAAYVGGCPTNVCVGARRLGLRAAMLNAVGDDLVGDFVQSFLEREGVETRFGVRKPGRRTSAFMLAIEPPDRFSIVPYRDNCADLELTVEDVRAAPVADARALVLTGTGLSRQPSRDATLFAAQTARAHQTRVVLDLDFRPELWPDARDYGAALGALLPHVDIVLGTTEEIKTALPGLAPGGSGGGKISAAGALVESEVGVAAMLSAGPRAVVEKRGGESTRVHFGDGRRVEVATFRVEVMNVLGAGDAFAAGFLYGHLRSWGWQRAVRLGNACGAIVVTRHGCANFMPTEREALWFIETHGGF